ncbi:PapB family radical SAM/SPASM ranthipeptide maturase [Clostridium sp. LIBA-8841]|uniref:PapB family radical SAM/SPASM ranthipeptide maturase n=1 Tax=Clostridium sp. LIBA-8841 TaxID=2987530 RepID=UPI002AC51FB1|nr:radical SAM protein [Clostridium sp. LIBA-8841]MDZ5255179.1 SPASM domain-containing protein [Clostridium sp. LIBA-8841]
MNNFDRVLEFYPFKIFKQNNKIYLYTINSNGLFELDYRTLLLIENEGKSIKEAYNNLKHLFSKNEFIEVLIQMEQVEFLKGFEKIYNNDTYLLDKKLSSLTLMVIQECNMRCKYCYGDGGEYSDKGKMNKEVALKAIDFLIDNTDERELLIAFLGGEPLLNFKLIKEVVNYCKIKEKKYNKKFSYTITTNGTVINDEIEEFLVENNISIQISIDGVKEKHNENRYFSNKRESYDEIIIKTKNIRKYDKITARATATKNNLNFIEIFNHLNSLGFKCIPIALAQNLLDDNDYKKATEEYVKFINYFENLIKEKKYFEINKFPMLKSALEKIEFSNKRSLGCGAGRNTYAVDIYGNLFPCHRFVANKEYCVGSIFKKFNNIDKFIKKFNVYSHKQCENCWVQNLCLGGCPNENLVNTGNIQTSSYRNCNFTKIIYEEIIKLYLRLDDEDKKHIFENI